MAQRNGMMKSSGFLWFFYSQARGIPKGVHGAEAVTSARQTHGALWCRGTCRSVLGVYTASRFFAVVTAVYPVSRFGAGQPYGSFSYITCNSEFQFSAVLLLP
jgi:hypothetical protein